MSKYIDADRLIETLNKEKVPFNDDVNYFILNAQAADVVEVVRCKDCKHRKYDDFMKEFVCDLDAVDPYERSRCAEDDEWFCKDGERR